MLAGYNPDNVINCVHNMLQRDRDWSNPFGNGKTGEEILRLLLSTARQ